MTAIAMVYVVPGFVIAADGRRRWADRRSIDKSMKSQEVDNQQKIFRARFKGRNIAYALTGLAFNHDRTFDLFEETISIATDRCAHATTRQWLARKVRNHRLTPTVLEYSVPHPASKQRLHRPSHIKP